MTYCRRAAGSNTTNAGSAPEWYTELNSMKRVAPGIIVIKGLKIQDNILSRNNIEKNNVPKRK